MDAFGNTRCRGPGVVVWSPGSTVPFVICRVRYRPAPYPCFQPVGMPCPSNMSGNQICGAHHHKLIDESRAIP